MQQIFNFIFKNSNRLLFLLLLGISFSLTIQSHSYHKSKIISSANFLSGGVYEKINDVSEYFNLRTQNDALALENARLKSLLFKTKDSLAIKNFTKQKNNLPEDIVVSKVIHNSYNVHENFLTLNSGSLQGIKPDMGVVNNLGIVGIIDNTALNPAITSTVRTDSGRSTVTVISNIPSPAVQFMCGGAQASSVMPSRYPVKAYAAHCPDGAKLNST